MILTVCLDDLVFAVRHPVNGSVVNLLACSKQGLPSVTRYQTAGKLSDRIDIPCNRMGSHNRTWIILAEISSMVDQSRVHTGKP